jgi:hypothetical protein
MRFLWAALLAFGLACGLAGVAEAQPRQRVCTAPSPLSLLPGGVTQVFPELTSRTLTLGSGAERVQWMVASWMGPMNGHVVVLDCTGLKIADAKLGYLRTMEPGPVLPGAGRTLRVRAVTSTGTGVLEETDFVLGLVEGEVARLWEHPALLREAIDPTTAHEDRFTAKLAKDGTRIEVAGVRVTLPYRGRKSTSSPLPAAAFCWDGKGYAACP